MPISSFIYRSFDASGQPLLTLKANEGLLPSQTHALPVLATIERQLASAERSWRMCLKVEETDPFNLEFSMVGQEAAVLRIQRQEIDAILILLSDAAGSVDLPTLRVVQKALETFVPADCMTSVFDWVTGLPPPLAAMVHLQGSPNNGLDLLAMCVADRFFKPTLEPS